MSNEVENPFVRNFRNFFVIGLLSSIVLFICFYITGLLVVVSINGNLELIKAYMNLPIDKQTIYLYKTIIAYWKFYIINFDKLTKESYNGFVPKLWVSSTLPYLFLMTVCWIFRAPLMDWRPFVKPESIHGDAHWATPKEIKKMGLRSKTGLLLGSYQKKMLIADGYQHILLFAPTGSGKGVGFVVPNLLFWRDSVIVHDIKLENYELSSGWRRSQLKQKVFLWNPADPDGISHCYNPMDWISKKPGQMVDDVQKI